VLFPKSHNALWLFVLGPIWALIYYGVFTFAIRKFNLLTPGREVEEPTAAGARAASGDQFRAPAGSRFWWPIEYHQS
jgi:PTS system glucose-specific IIC component